MSGKEDSGEYAAQLESCLQSLETLQKTVNDKYDDAVKRLNKNFLDIDAALAKRTHLQKECSNCQALLQEAKSVCNIETEKILSFQTRLEELRKYTDFLGKTKRKVGSNFLRYIMGHVSVRVWNESDRKQLKIEYNKFKQIGTFCMILFPISQLVIGFSWVLHQWHQVCAVYYYFSLSIRENVLKLNGSRIKRWWIVHHYLTIIQSFLSLMICRSVYNDYQGYFAYLTYLSLWNGCVMWVQNQYQEARHYARVAMGKASIFDGTTSETLVEAPSQSSTWYYFLVPLLYMTYMFEIILAGYCFSEFLYNYTRQNRVRIFEMEFLLVCVVWIAIAFGNVTTTSRIVYAKQRNQRLDKELRRIRTPRKKIL